MPSSKALFSALSIWALSAGQPAASLDVVVSMVEERPGWWERSWWWVVEAFVTGQMRFGWVASMGG